MQLSDFLDHPRLKAVENRLDSRFTKEQPLIISDVIDEQGNQYAHLVQKGGGVLGVALVGYTFILERMGIRFIRQAGTSAGAINTALMTVTGTKQEAKSVRVLDAVCKLDFFSLVDGHPFARRLIRSFITDTSFVQRSKKWLIGLVTGIMFLILADFILLANRHKSDMLMVWAWVAIGLTIFTAIVIFLSVRFASRLLKKLKNAGYGINKGDRFYEWIKERFGENGVKTVRDLNEKATAKVPGMKMRYEHPSGLTGLEGSVTFITSELSSRNKVELPEMCDLFRRPGDDLTLDPAGFVRASMAIPLFFESYLIKDIPCTTPEIKNAWKKRFNEDDPPSIARFVDGGMLSNFPMDIFYNPSVEVPRLPVLGIDLDGSSPGDKGKKAESWSLGGYCNRMLLTLQNHSDKQFLQKNKVYATGVGCIDVRGFNSLNFFLTDDKKMELFLRGAEAACEFLLRFNWNDYKRERAIMQQTLNR
ncbi:MAG: patatin-like phospholipase family protein [Chitinophagaceae bacterium]